MNTILEFLQNNVGIITLLFATVGGVFALTQWRTQITHKRAEIVHEMIRTIRDDEKIAAVMDVIDWDNGLKYDGSFHMSPNAKENEKSKIAANSAIINADDNSLFAMVDRTLVHFSYICYLKQRGAFSEADVEVFQYALRRIADNKQIANYLFSIYHFSKRRKATCSFKHLIKYLLKKRYLHRSFKNRLKCTKYTCYLHIAETKKERRKRIKTERRLERKIEKQKNSTIRGKR